MKRIRTAALLLLTCSAASLAGCGEDDPVPGAVDLTVEFEHGTVVIESAADTLTLGVEVAQSAAQRARGLMQRDSLHPDSGMIFLFEAEQPADGVFWMYNTRIPLSIAFIGQDGRIGSIVEMEPCTSPYPQWCRNYEAGVPFHSALEVNAGYFTEHRIGVGDLVTLVRD